MGRHTLPSRLVHSTTLSHAVLKIQKIWHLRHRMLACVGKSMIWFHIRADNLVPKKPHLIGKQCDACDVFLLVFEVGKIIAIVMIRKGKHGINRSLERCSSLHGSGCQIFEWIWGTLRFSYEVNLAGRRIVLRLEGMWCSYNSGHCDLEKERS